MVVVTIDPAPPRSSTTVVPVTDTSGRDGAARRVHYFEEEAPSGHCRGNSESDPDPGFDSLGIAIAIGIALETMRIRGRILLLFRRRRRHRCPPRRGLLLLLVDYAGVDASPPTVDRCD